MSKLNVPLSMSNIKTIEDLSRYASIWFDEIKRVIGGNISFTDNIFVSRQSVTFSGSGLDITVTHGLKVIPTGYLVVRNSGITVFDGSNAEWTESYIFLQASAAGTATVLIFA